MAGRKKAEADEVQLSLEEAFVKLDHITQALEDEQITLEDSFITYKQGMELLKYCNDTIDKVEKKVLMLNEDGGMEEYAKDSSL